MHNVRIGSLALVVLVSLGAWGCVPVAGDTSRPTVVSPPSQQSSQSRALEDRLDRIDRSRR
jgi:hypothetical protein